MEGIEKASITATSTAAASTTASASALTNLAQLDISATNTVRKANTPTSHAFPNLVFCNNNYSIWTGDSKKTRTDTSSIEGSHTR